MENNNQQFNEENVSSRFDNVIQAFENFKNDAQKLGLDISINTLGQSIKKFLEKNDLTGMSLKREDLLLLDKIVNRGQSTYEVFSKLNDSWSNAIENETPEQKVVRIYNNVGDAFAVSAGGIGESIKNSAEALIRADDDGLTSRQH
ncbi:hypothetical protein [Paenibacillus sp. USHLN196]|uniref:hypothetical protein n=1 Tax=Paenibacillus sp. USHLN196 TaxID=3081291 RepID=UPI00301B14FB